MTNWEVEQVEKGLDVKIKWDKDKCTTYQEEIKNACNEVKNITAGTFRDIIYQAADKSGMVSTRNKIETHDREFSFRFG